MNTDPTKPTPLMLAGLDLPMSRPGSAGELVVRAPMVVDAVIFPHPTRPTQELRWSARPPLVVDAVILSRSARPTRQPQWWIRPLVIALLMVAALAGLAGFVWLIVQAVLSVVAAAEVVVAWTQAHLLLIGLGVGSLLLLLLRSRAGSACAGLHCGGCRR